MGSSTTSASEATINTSTESASTLVTNVTATDTSEIGDSLDFGMLIYESILYIYVIGNFKFCGKWKNVII